MWKSQSSMGHVPPELSPAEAKLARGVWEEGRKRRLGSHEAANGARGNRPARRGAKNRGTAAPLRHHAIHRCFASQAEETPSIRWAFRSAAFNSARRAD